MAKGKKRLAMQAEKERRLRAQMGAGGQSKYAAKHLRNARGDFAPTSPSHVDRARGDETVDEARARETDPDRWLRRHS